MGTGPSPVVGPATAIVMAGTIGQDGRPSYSGLYWRWPPRENVLYEGSEPPTRPMRTRRLWRPLLSILRILIGDEAPVDARCVPPQA